MNTIFKLGERTISDWIDKPECSSIIDVTSSKKEQKITNEIIDIEIDSSLFEDEIVTKVAFNLSYTLQGIQKTETITFKKNDNLPLQSIRYAVDKNTLKFYTITKHLSGEDTPVTENKKELNENYIYINNF